MPPKVMRDGHIRPRWNKSSRRIVAASIRRWSASVARWSNRPPGHGFVGCAEDLRRRRYGAPEPAQQVGASGDAGQWIDIARLEAFTQCLIVERLQRAGIGPQRIAGPCRERGGHEHRGAREREALRAAHGVAGDESRNRHAGPAPASSSTLTIARSNPARARAASSRQPPAATAAQRSAPSDTKCRQREWKGMVRSG